jgi:hypothetical protein
LHYLWVSEDVYDPLYIARRLERASSPFVKAVS